MRKYFEKGMNSNSEVGKILKIVFWSSFGLMILSGIFVPALFITLPIFVISGISVAILGYHENK
jgi:hypothetical protein